jgi:hypothetical protein
MSKSETSTNFLSKCFCQEGKIVQHTTTFDSGYINSSGTSSLELMCDKCAKYWQVNGTKIICNAPDLLPENYVGICVVNIRHKSFSDPRLVADYWWIDNDHRLAKPCT